MKKYLFILRLLIVLFFTIIIFILGLYVYAFITPKVIINEAIELAHEYSDEKVVKMINSVLDRVYHNECE